MSNWSIQSSQTAEGPATWSDLQAAATVSAKAAEVMDADALQRTNTENPKQILP